MGEKNERDPERETPTHYSAIDVSVLGEVARDLLFHPCGRARDPEVLNRIGKISVIGYDHREIGRDITSLQTP